MRNFITNLVLLVAFTLTTSVAFANNTPANSIKGQTIATGNHITWSIAATEDISFFMVQRSNDGVHFAPVALLPKTVKTNFSFTDTQAGNQNWFYRVVKVDDEGTGNFMKTIFLPSSVK